MMNNKGMFFFYDWMDLLDEFDDAEVGRVVKAIVHYAQSGEMEEFSDRGLRIVMKSMKASMDLSAKKGKDISEARKDAASKRWNANACKDMQTDANGCKAMQTDANAYFASEQNANDAISISKSISKSESKSISESESISKSSVVVPTKRISASSMIEERAFPTDLDLAVKDWVKYKTERREAYKETGLRNLLSEIESRVAQHGSQPVIDVIRLSMSNGWKGIIWDRISDRKKTQSATAYFLSQAGGA